MGLMDRLIKYNTCQLFVGEIYEPHAFRQDENGKNTGEVKASSVLKKDICIQNANGDYVSIVNNGTVYSAGREDQIVNGEVRYPYFFWNVKPYYEVSGKKTFSTSKHEIIKFYEKLNTQYRLDKLVLFTLENKEFEIKHVLGCYVEDFNRTEESSSRAGFYPWGSFFGGNKICDVDENHNLVYDKYKGMRILSADTLILVCPEMEDVYKNNFLTDHDLNEINAYIKVLDNGNVQGLEL